MITFAVVPANDEKEDEAYDWHSDFAASDPNIFLRTEDQYKEMIANGQVWAAWNQDGKPLGSAYCTLDETTWEIGGVMAAREGANLRVGAKLAYLVLGNLLVSEDPLALKHVVAARIHVNNSKLGPILERRLKFKYARNIKVAATDRVGAASPPRSEMEGREFHLMCPETLQILAKWCDAQNSGHHRDDESRIELPFGLTLEMWADSIRDMAKKC